MEKYVLVSVYRKEGIEKVAKILLKYGYRIIATEGTARYLMNNGIKVNTVEELTGFKQTWRVKTLYHEIFSKILSVPPEIKIVIVNLYPFEKKKEEGLREDELVEFIDIGGVSLLRAGAKNYKYVTCIKFPEEYALLIEQLEKNNGETTLEFRKEMAKSCFVYTSFYDYSISTSLFDLDDYFAIYAKKDMELKYGENPHQKAVYYRIFNSDFKVKEHLGHSLSYNNLLDIHRAILVVNEFSSPCCAVIKHMVPCGVAIGKTIEEAVEKAYHADPVSAYGGILSINRPLNREIAEFMKGKFFEVAVAPCVEEEVLPMMQKKKRLRLVSFEGNPLSFEIRTVMGGFLYQHADNIKEDSSNWRIVSKRKPSQEEMRALEFAWKVVKHLKSNAVCITDTEKTLGIGTGQPNRVNSVKIAVEQAKKYTGIKVLASDGFFPFRDSVDTAVSAGVTAIIEPGGSIRDEEIIKAADEHGITLVFTGIRHFLH